jgi:hypothetical protein
MRWKIYAFYIRLKILSGINSSYNKNWKNYIQMSNKTYVVCGMSWNIFESLNVRFCELGISILALLSQRLFSHLISFLLLKEGFIIWVNLIAWLYKNRARQCPYFMHLFMIPNYIAQSWEILTICWYRPLHKRLRTPHWVSVYVWKISQKWSAIKWSRSDIRFKWFIHIVFFLKKNYN